MALQYVMLNRDCLRDVREHEEPHQLQLRNVQRPEDCRPWLDEQLARIQASNARSRHPRVTAEIDRVLRILSGMTNAGPLEDPTAILRKEVLSPWLKPPQDRIEYPREVVAKVHSVLAAMAHGGFYRCIRDMRAGVPTEVRFREPGMAQLAVHEPRNTSQVQLAVGSLGNATQHAREAANAGFFSRTVATVAMDFRDIAAWHGVDISRDPRFDTLLCAVAEYQPLACLEEAGNMLDNPETGFGSPLCAMPTCISYGRMRTPREYPNLVRCTDGCPDAVHATYCSVRCREQDKVRHATAAKGAFKLEPPICLRNAEAARALQEVLKKL